jgi:molecular chaperone GrpE
MAAPLPGSLAARMAHARAQRLKELERRVSEAAQLPPPPDDRPSPAAPLRAAAGRQATDEPTSVAGRPTLDACGSVPDDAASRWTFAEPDDVEETGSHATDQATGDSRQATEDDLLTPDAPLRAAHAARVPEGHGAGRLPPVAETGSQATATTSHALPPADELRRARTEIAQLQAQAWRAQEELASIRRRSERDREDLGHAARSDAIVPMLPIVDDLERALAHVPAALRDDPWVAGIMMIGDSLQRVLERQGVERIVPCHAPFDPHLHEAVAQVEATDVAQDTVIQVYRPGYMYNGRVLRAAQVQVAVKKEQ